MLFVPGHKLDWMLKAPRYGADGLILDLEDAVGPSHKPAARETVARAVAELKDHPCGVFVRVNDWRTGHLLADVLAVVGEGLDGVMLPKAEGPLDVGALDLVLSDLEAARGLPAGRIEIAPLAETAAGMRRLYDSIMASPRVKRAGVIGGTGNGGDGTRALGITIGESGDEGLYFDAHQVLQARAAGLSQVWGGMIAQIGDLELVRRVSIRNRRLGGTGAMAIHPSHVPILNDVYGPSAEEIGEARETIAAVAAGLARGDAAVQHRGAMVDAAQAVTAVALIRRARSMGLDVGDVPELPPN
jgi:citrate lyase subunit beta/citryl-CoA lyase